MKRTLHKRAGLWELSIPLRAPVRGIWRYPSFEEAWGHLWKTGYPPGLPGEIKMAGNAEPPPPGVEYLDDVDGPAHDAAAQESLPDAAPAPPFSWRSLLIAAGLAFGLATLLVTQWGPLSHRGSPARPSGADSNAPKAALPTPKPAADPVLPPASNSGKSHASIRANDRSWITACVDGKLVFSKLFNAGSNESVDFIDRAVVRMGDAGPVEITLDGKTVGSLGGMGQVRVIELVRGTTHFLVGGEAGDCTVGKSR